MASISCFPDVHAWLQNLPPLPRWKTTSYSLNLCSSSSSSLVLCVSKNPQSTSVSISIVAEFLRPLSLWTSKNYFTKPNSEIPLDHKMVSDFFVNLIEAILSYGPNSNSMLSIRFPDPTSLPYLKDIFNLSFVVLTFLVCIYEAPVGLRSSCLGSVTAHLVGCQSRDAPKLLMRFLGSNLEERWMRTVNLAITNWILEAKASVQISIKTPSPLFSYAVSAFGLWKVHLYCPVIAMDKVDISNHAADEKLDFSLNYHHLEGVIQFNHRVVSRENWVEVSVNTDNVRYDVIKLASDTLMRERGVGAEEKHFPSRISLQVTPIMQDNIISVSVGKSTENPATEIGLDKAMEVGFDPPHPYPNFKLSAGEHVGMSLKPWKFEESVVGYSARFSWFLHDPTDGKEVSSYRPSMVTLINPKAWFRDRYSTAYRPFTRQGGVVFAGDEYGQGAKWKVGKGERERKGMDWEVRGWIWLTYWPNKYRTFYHETRRLQFREILHLPIA